MAYAEAFSKDNTELTIYSRPIKSKLIIIDESVLTIQTQQERPNWWWRMWQYLLLGFKWEKL